MTTIRKSMAYYRIKNDFIHTTILTDLPHVLVHATKEPHG